MQKFLEQFDGYLTTIFADPEIPHELKVAMEYSLLNGGKRIRPSLCFATALLESSHNVEDIFPLAAAIEMVHTYSLIHDDLPAMDDDDMRRGKASNHKQFTEATAILAGDGLLSHSFYILQELKAEPSKIIAINRLFAQTIGITGMVAGQIDDIAAELNKTLTLADLEAIQLNKTGKLFACAITGTALFFEYPAEIQAVLANWWQQLGKLFQAVDDLLDDDPTTGKTVGIDAANGKITMLSLLGRDGLYNYIDTLTTGIKQQLVTLDDKGYNTASFAQILSQIVAKI